MSGLEALGVACSIFQVISFSREALQVAKGIYRDGSFNPDVGQNASDIEAVMGRMTSRSNTLPKSRENQALLDTCAKCQATAKELVDELSGISTASSAGNLVSTVKTAGKAFYHRRNQSTSSVEDKIDILDADVQYFFQQYRDGHRDTTELISKEAAFTRQEVTRQAEELREHVTREVKGNQNAVTDKVDLLYQTDEHRRICDRFLRSFKFDGMNERRNEVRESSPKTFKWVFRYNEENGSAFPSQQTNDSDNTSDEDSLDDEAGPEVVWNRLPEWLQTEKSDKPYWISGKPGSGKTTLVKYIIGHKRTLICLHKWRKDTIIVSHFVWKLGARGLQKNLKGILCSLIHQLLERSPIVLAAYATEETAGSKDTESDWSTRELVQLLKRITTGYDNPVCVFIDGLDELETPNDISQCFGVIDQLTGSDNVKVCLASRAEPVFRIRFDQNPKLRLQDLTYKDISRYVHGNMTFRSNDITEEQQDDIVSIIVSKAEGVFLWAYLVVSNLKRGLDLGDDYDILKQRVESLPGDLADLYRDMWRRMNGHDNVYQDSAANYLKLALAWQATTIRVPLTPLLIVLANSPHICRGILNQPTLPVSVSSLTESSAKLLKTVGTRCAGVLELYEENSFVACDQTAYQDLVPYADAKHGAFRFIHRTASDFLRDTSDGRNIIAKEPASEAELILRLIDAVFALCQLFRCKGIGDLDNWMLWFHDWQHYSNLFRSTNLKRELSQRIDICKTLSERGRLLEDMNGKYRHCKPDRFYTLAAQNCLNEWIVGKLETHNIPSQLNSKMLLHAGRWSDNLDRQLELCCQLLRHGGYVNSAQFLNERYLQNYSRLQDRGESRFAVYREPFVFILGIIIAQIPLIPEWISPVLSFFCQLIESQVDLGMPTGLFLEHSHYRGFTVGDHPAEGNEAAPHVFVYARADTLISAIVDGLYEQMHRDFTLHSEEEIGMVTDLHTRFHGCEQRFEKILIIREPVTKESANKKSIVEEAPWGGVTDDVMTDRRTSGLETEAKAEEPTQDVPPTVAHWVEGEWHEKISKLIFGIMESDGPWITLADEMEIVMQEFWAQADSPQPFWRYYPECETGPFSILRYHGCREAWVKLDELFGPVVGWWDHGGKWIEADANEQPQTA